MTGGNVTTMTIMLFNFFKASTQLIKMSFSLKVVTIKLKRARAKNVNGMEHAKLLVYFFVFT